MEEVLLEVQGLLADQVDHEKVVQGVLVDFDEVLHRELVDQVLDEEHGVEVVLDEEQRVEVDFEEVHGVEVVFEDEQRVEVDQDLLQLDDFLVEVVHGLLEVVGLQGVEHEVLVQVVAGVQVQVLQLVATTGLPAVVILWSSQCFEVVVAGRHSLPPSHTTVGHTGPVSYVLVTVGAGVTRVREPAVEMHVAPPGYECAGLHA